MKIALALLMRAAAGRRMGDLDGEPALPVRPGVFGVEGLTIVFAVWMTLEARRCG
jgi:hypothetical protein